MIICHCTAATLKEIEESFVISKTLKDVQYYSGAGIGCGTCWEYVQELWDAYRRDNDRKAHDNTADEGSQA